MEALRIPVSLTFETDNESTTLKLITSYTTTTTKFNVTAIVEAICIDSEDQEVQFTQNQPLQPAVVLGTFPSALSIRQ
jgi:PBP1b-binding outer membrane lipoprotein LpoB